MKTFMKVIKYQRSSPFGYNSVWHGVWLAHTGTVKARNWRRPCLRWLWRSSPASSSSTRSIRFCAHETRTTTRLQPWSRHSSCPCGTVSPLTTTAVSSWWALRIDRRTSIGPSSGGCLPHFSSGHRLELYPVYPIELGAAFRNLSCPMDPPTISTDKLAKQFFGIAGSRATPADYFHNFEARTVGRRRQPRTPGRGHWRIFRLRFERTVSVSW